MNLTDAELKIMMTSFLAIKDYIPNARLAEDRKQQLTTMVNDSLSILRKTRGNSKPMGGSVIDKTKELFDMFGLDKRIKR